MNPEKTKEKSGAGQSPKPIMRRLGYIRTSTDKQLLDRQIIGLNGHCDEIHVEDGVSATRKNRPVYENLKDSLQSGDVLVVWSIDRAFRSAVDALLELGRLDARGVQFHSVTQNFDTRTLDGKLQFTIIAALAEWERGMISRRTKEGLQAARSRGVTLGRPRLSVDISSLATTESGITATAVRKLAKQFGVSDRTIRRRLREIQD